MIGRAWMPLSTTSRSKGSLASVASMRSQLVTNGKMPVVKRQFVGGTTRDAGWFGSMRGNGYFQQRLNDDRATLDAALNHIPIKGIVSKRRFDGFAAR